MHVSLGSRLWLGFGLALLVLAGNGAIALYNTRALTDYQDQVVHSYAALSHINAVLTLVDDAETGQRGYILTGKRGYLRPYTNAVSQVPAQLSQVQALVMDDAVLQRDDTVLEPLVADKVNEMVKTVQLQAAHHHKRALRLVVSGRGQRYMRNIRSVIGHMQVEEQKLLARRTAQAQEHSTSTSDTILIATLANIVLLVIVVLLSARAVRQRERVSRERARLLARAEAAREQAEIEQQRATTSAAQQAAILNQITDGIIIADNDARIVYLNPAGQQILGTSEVGTALQAHPAVYHTYKVDGTEYQPEELPLSRAVLQAETLYAVPVMIQRPNGARIYLETNATPLITDEGTQFGAVATFRDVTMQRDMERQKEEFLSTVAHDLKTPLTAVKGLAQLLQRRARRAGPIDQTALLDGLGRIDATATHMTSMIDEMLDMTRLQMGHGLELNARTADLIPLLQRLVADQRAADSSSSARGRRHEIRLQTQLTSLVGQWDIERLDRVFGNILANAVKYSPNGGQITVTAEQEAIDGVPYAVVAVSDEGLGINPDDLPLVFDRFHRGSNVRDTIPGTGIGLAGARTIVEEHGGAITVTSREGQGSTFVVRLPLSPQAVAEQGPAAPAAH